MFPTVLMATMVIKTLIYASRGAISPHTTMRTTTQETAKHFAHWGPSVSTPALLIQSLHVRKIVLQARLLEILIESVLLTVVQDYMETLLKENATLVPSTVRRVILQILLPTFVYYQLTVRQLV